MKELAHELKRKKFLEHQIKKRKRLKPDQLLFDVRIEDFNKTNKKFESLKLSEFTCAFLAGCGFCSAVLSSIELSDNFFTNVHLILSSITTAILLYSIYRRTVCELKWEQARMIHSSADTLYTTKKYQVMLFEFIINLVHPTYGMQWQKCTNYNKVLEVEITYDLITIISCIMMIRVYHVIRCLFVISKYKTSRFRRLCKIYGAIPDNWFAFKCMMKEIPASILLCMSVFGLFVGSYALFVFEYPTKQHGGKDFTKFGNAIWCVIATMSTVGYGDFFPVTDAGRLVGFFTCIWGVLTMSLTAVTFSNLLALNQGESTSLQMLERLWFKESLKKKAAFVLTSSVRLSLMKIRGASKNKIWAQFIKFRLFLKDFQNFKILKKTLYDYDSYTDRIEMKLLEAIDYYEKANEYVDLSNEIVEYFQRKQMVGEN